MRKLCLLGDSIVNGFGVATGKGWADLVAKTMTWKVITCGWDGSPAFHMVDRMEREVIPHSPDYVFILGGLNDLLLYGRSVDNVMKSYQTMINKAREAEIKPIIGINCDPGFCVDPSLDSWGIGGADSCAKIRCLREDLLALGQEEELLVVDFFARLHERRKQDYTDLFSDGVHPTVEGHREMAEVFLDFWRREFGEL